MATKNLPAITPKQAIETITKQFPAEAEVLTAFVKNNLAVLGTDEVFALRDKDGDIRAFKSVCHLSLANGGLVKLPIAGGIIIVSAQGYEFWQEKAAAHVIFPTEVIIDGQRVPNPARMKNADGEWCGWTVRAVAYRFSSMGILQVSDRTVNFDIDNHKNIDFLAKAKKKPQAFKIHPAGAKAPDAEGTWVEYPFDKYSSLWVNAAHEEALDWYSEISQMIKNSLQLAQTHASRNALKHLSGLQKAPDQTGEWDIPVIAWRPINGGIIKFDQTMYKNIQNRVNLLSAGEDQEGKQEVKQIDVSSGVDTIGKEDLAAVDAGEVDETNITPEDKDTAIDVTTKPKKDKKAAGKITSDEGKPVLDKEEKKVMRNFELMKAQFPEEFKQACDNTGIRDKVDKYSLEDALAITAEMNKILDAQ